MLRLKIAIAMLGVLFVAGGARADDLNLGLVDYYQFHGNLDDSSGFGLNLTAEPGAVFNYVANQVGAPASAVQMITAGDGTFFVGTGPNLANQSSSVSFWVEKNYVGDGSNGSWLFGLGPPHNVGGSGGQDMHVALDYGDDIRYSFFYDDFDNSTSLSVDTWYDLTFTFDYTTGVRDMYVDGSLIATDVANTPFSGGDSLQIGGTFASDGLTLDDFLFYNRVLTQSEVNDLATGSVPTVPEGGDTLRLLAPLFAGLVLLVSKRPRAA